MALEIRKGRPYLYRTWTAGDKTHSVYIGNHPIALTGHLVLQAARLAKARHREDLDHLRGYLEQVDPHLDLLDAELRLVETALLMALGLHNPKGIWRKKQGIGSWTDSPVSFPDPVSPTRSVLNTDLCRSPGASPAFPLPHHILHPMKNQPLSTLKELMKQAGLKGNAEAFTSSADAQPDETMVDYAADSLKPGAPDLLFDRPGLDWDKIGTDPEMLQVLQDEARNMIVMLKKAPPCQETADTVRKALTEASHALPRSAIGLVALVATLLARALHPDDELAQYKMLKALDDKRAELGWREALPHERPFIDQLALTQHIAELTMVGSRKIGDEIGSNQPMEHYWAQRLQQTQDRLQRASERLARLRLHTRKTKAIQGDLARYLERIAPPLERSSKTRWQWAPATPPAPKTDDTSDGDAEEKMTPEEYERACLESQMKFARMAMEEDLKRRGITEWNDLDTAFFGVNRNSGSLRANPYRGYRSVTDHIAEQFAVIPVIDEFELTLRPGIAPPSAAVCITRPWAEMMHPDTRKRTIVPDVFEGANPGALYEAGDS